MQEVDVELIAALSRPELQAKWRSLFGQAAPAKISRKLMIQVICSQEQWTVSGLSKPYLMRRIASCIGGDKASNAIGIAPGTRLIREWHGTKHIVDVTPDGFRWQDRTWTSLSAIAREITGARWSGPRFFGVKGQM